MSRLDTIALRQRRTRVRDFMFAAVVALAAAISVTTISTAANAASTHFVAR